MKRTLENEKNLTLVQGMVEQLIVEDGVCKGVIRKRVLFTELKQSSSQQEHIYAGKLLLVI